MKILIVYATYSGSTEAAAKTAGNTFIKNKHTVNYKNPAKLSPIDITDHDLIVLCSPTWDYEGKDGQPHEDYFKLFKNIKHKNTGGKFAIISLGDSSYPKFCGSKDVLEKFVNNIGGTLLNPTIKIDGFYYNESENSAKIANWATKFK